MKPFRPASPRASRLPRAVLAVALGALAGGVAAPAPVLGAPQAGQVGQVGPNADRVRELFRKGRDELSKGRFPQARDLLLEAWGLQKTFDIAGNLAQAEGQVGRWRDAAEHASFALANFPAGGTEEQRKALEELVSAARANIGAVTVQVSVERAAVTVDDKPAGESPLPYEVFVDPGDHTIAAAAPGCDPAKDTLHTEKGATRLVKLTLRCGPTLPPQQHVTPPVTDQGPRPLTVAGFVTTGVGVGLGTAFAILSRTKADDANQRQGALSNQGGSMACAGSLAGTRASDCMALSDARAGEATFANAALGAFIAASVVGAGTLVYTFVVPREAVGSDTHPPDPSKTLPQASSAKTVSIRVSPLAGPGAGGVVLKGAF